MSELRKVCTTVDARDRIVEAALTVFSQRGFDGATTREIAREAGVSSALTYHHFKDKETLWNPVDQRISEEFIETITSAMDPALRGTSKGVRKMMAAYMNYWREHPRSCVSSSGECWVPPRRNAKRDPSSSTSCSFRK